MDNQEAIDVLQEKISPCVAGKWKEAVDAAISVLQTQDSKTRKFCDTCKHNPPSKKWPCVDCDMKEPADRWEPNDVPDTNVGDTVSRKAAIDVAMEYGKKVPTYAIRVKNAIEQLPPAQKKGYTKADYIMALHKEYGCSLARAEEAHQKALEYLRNTSMMKG